MPLINASYHMAMNCALMNTLFIGNVIRVAIAVYELVDRSVQPVLHGALCSVLLRALDSKHFLQGMEERLCDE